MPTTDRVRQIARGRNVRLFRAFLAEDYDGIGQYVTIALSRASIASAFKARVAAGDFGTLTPFPQGTEVAAFSYHGQIEILSLGMKPTLDLTTIPTDPPEVEQPADCADVIFDLFERSESGSWGTNLFGLDYSYTGISGNITPGSGNFQSVADFGEGSVGRIRWETGTPNIFFGPNGDTNGTDVGPWQEDLWTFKMRFKTGDWNYGGNDGYATIQVGTNARYVNLITGSNVGFSFEHGSIETDDSAEYDFDWHPNTWYLVKWRYDFLTGDSWLKVWEEGDTEPDWLITESSYGGAGGDDPSKWMRVRGDLKGAHWDSTTPYNMYFDDFYFCYV